MVNIIHYTKQNGSTGYVLFFIYIYNSTAFFECNYKQDYMYSQIYI